MHQTHTKKIKRSSLLLFGFAVLIICSSMWLPLRAFLANFMGCLFDSLVTKIEETARPRLLHKVRSTAQNEGHPHFTLTCHRRARSPVMGAVYYLSFLSLSFPLPPPPLTTSPLLFIAHGPSPRAHDTLVVAVVSTNGDSSSWLTCNVRQCSGCLPESRVLNICDHWEDTSYGGCGVWSTHTTLD